jgi:hypothetical protein
VAWSDRCSHVATEPGFVPGFFWFAPRTSRLAHGSPSASRERLGFAIALYTWASRGGDLGAHPRCSDSPPRSRRKAAHAAHVSIWPTAAPLVRNSPRGWTPRSLTTIRFSGRRAVAWCRRRPRPLAELPADADAIAAPGCRSRPSLLCQRADVPADDAAARFGSTHASLRARESLRCPPSRRVPHKWSGRRPHRTWSAQRTFRYETRRTV